MYPSRLAKTAVLLLLLLALPCAALAEPLSSAEHLRRAEESRDLFELEKALEHYEAALAGDASPGAERSFASYLLALASFDRAAVVLESAVERFPMDPVLLELRAELAAARGEHGDAVLWLERAWGAGRDRLSWIDRGRLRERLHEEPYRTLLGRVDLLAGFAEADEAVKVDRLLLLVDVIATAEAERLTSHLAEATSPEVLRAGLRALRRVRGPYVERLLASGEARVRRAVLLEVWRQREASYLEALEAQLAVESDRGNFDLLEVLVAALGADRRGLEAISAASSYRHLALYELAGLSEKSGDFERAADLRREASAVRPKVAVEGALADYWECQDRADLQEIRSLLEHHKNVEPIDARVYGLPRHDFDDQKNLTIPERLFLRAYFREEGIERPTSGALQYPREIRHFLRRLGSGVDCSGYLGELPEKLVQEDGSEIKLQNDSAADNEVHIAVNPNDPRHVVATSNPTGNGGNKVFRSSNWGNSWSVGSATVANNCCDPVSYYNRTSVSGTMTDVLYHSTLVGSADVTSRMIYSTDNGTSWNDCGTNIGSSRDRQDHAIDTNPSSACYNTIYLGHHNGTQYVAASTGQSFPYCQSWNEVSTGVGSTIGSAVVVSTNGTAHNFFTQYGTPGGVYQVATTNCGSSWGSATKIASIMNAGTFEWGIPSTCSRQVYRYPQADSDRQSQSAFLNNIYIVWNDLSGNCSAPGCNGNTTCNNDVYLAVGTPNNRANPTSWTWSTRNLTDAISDDFTDEFYPSLTVDQSDGAVYVTYYRSNSGAGGITARREQVHYVLLRSIDGAQTFEPPYQITDQPTNEANSGANSAMQWGDYAWNDVIEGVAYGVWTDRREGADEDVWAAKVCSEPSHWSERAPSFTKPATQATSAGGNTFTVSWTAPDLYWGDGGENTAARKYQLWVDGALVQDNLSAAATQTQWTAPDANQHSLIVRAVNQCGAPKDYAAKAVTGGGGGGNNPPQVSITAPANGSTVAEGTSIGFAGAATDTEDGTLTASLGWASSLDGAIGSGGSFSKVLSVGTHTVTASVNDSGGAPGSAQVTVTVEGASCASSWSEDFEGGTSGWTSAGLWHLADSTGCASPGYSSATHAMYYGQENGCDYDTGQTNTGDLLSPRIDGVTAQSVLTFQYFRQVEETQNSAFETTEVAVAEAGTSTWQTVWSKTSLDASENAWTASPSISLAAYAGKSIELRFRFDSADADFNDFVGWLIDDVAVSATACESGDAIFADGFESGDLTKWSGVVGAN